MCLQPKKLVPRVLTLPRVLFLYYYLSKLPFKVIQYIINPFDTGSIYVYKFTNFIFKITQKVTEILDSSLWQMKAKILTFKEGVSSRLLVLLLLTLMPFLKGF